MGYLYYPGCALKRTAIDYDESFQAVASHLGIEFKELKEWTCCGATVAKSISAALAESLPLQALRSADQEQMDLLTLCPSCHLNHRQMTKRLQEEAGLRDRLSLQGIPKVKQLLEVLAVDLGPAKIKEKRVRSLEGIKVVPYYGCLVTRPFPLGEKDSVENPLSMESLIEATGAQPVHFPYKSDCCGGGIFLSKEKVALKLSATILKEAVKHSPDCLVVACPLCHFMLDAKQRVIEREWGEKIGLPVLYMTQLLGIAMGIDHKKLGLHRLITSPSNVMQKINYRSR
ncbi:MAG: CoB--CoM heterodisulfide reductase iron-sulfur subunit B family protein [Syntrophales bacterium]|nr:CoB--CoM heterodisulfide reductase iron-sulfur subunit B family protein [Syntrophales bacterium]